MVDKILGLWTNLTPGTKRTIFICITGIIIVAMITGNFDTLCGLFGGKE